MKKILTIIFVIFCFNIFIFEFVPNSNGFVYCEDETDTTQIEEIITDSVNSQIDNLDFSEFENVLDNLTKEQIEIFGYNNFIEKVKSLINGEFKDNQTSIWSAILSLIFDNIVSIVPLISLVIAIGVVFSFVSASRPQSKNKSLGDVIHFVCYSAIIVILIGSAVSMIKLTSNTIQSIKTQIDLTLPILLTVMTAIGSNVSVSVYEPSVAVLSGSIIGIFTNILMPIFILILVFSIVANISNNIKLDKFVSFFSSLFKWILGGIFTIFSAFVAIQGITAGSVDGISIRTAKYAIKNSIPMLGSYLSDGLNLIVYSSVLIKNSIGACGLILLIATIIVPILKLLVYMLSLKFAAAIFEPITDSKITSFVSMLAKNITLLIVLILGCAFAYMLLCGIMMCTANVL